MNEQLQQALAALLNKTVSGIEAGASFLQAELPDVIQQLLTWKLAQASVMAAACVLGIIISFLLLRLVAKHTDNDQILSIEGGGIPTAIMAISLGGFSVARLSSWGSDAIQIWLAPKIYLIEYAASLAK